MTAPSLHPLDPKLSGRERGIVGDLVAHALVRARAADPLTWYDAVHYAKTHHAALGDNAPTVAVVAVNRLEETGEIVYDGDLRVRRAEDPHLANDTLAIEAEVASYMSAGRDTSVWKLYAEVFRRRHAHYDVYYACRALLAAKRIEKPNAQGALLRYVQPVTTTTVPPPASPSPLPVAELRERSRRVESLPVEHPERQQVEADMVRLYAEHLQRLKHLVSLEVKSAAGPCDLLDRTDRRLVEAKSDGSRSLVRSAWAQALDYRDELNAASDDVRAPVEELAILTPVPPCNGARAFLQRRLDDCGGTLTLVYPTETGWAADELEGE